MLPVRPWKTDAIIRLLLSVFICVYAGSLLVAAVHHPRTGLHAGWRFYPVLGVAFGCLGATLLLLRRPWRLEEMMRRLLTLLLCFYTGMLLGAWAVKMANAGTPSVGQMVIAALSFQGAALVLVSRFLREHGTNWTEGFGLCRQWPQALLLGIILACLFLPVGWSLQWLMAKLMVHVPFLHLKPEEQQAVQTLQMAATWRDRTALGLVTILLVPPAEETLFRGILYTWIKQAGFPRLALWGTSLLFAAIHLNLVSFLPLAVFALLLASLYERTGNLLAPISAHALFNALNFFMLYLLQEKLNQSP